MTVMYMGRFPNNVWGRVPSVPAADTKGHAQSATLAMHAMLLPWLRGSEVGREGSFSATPGQQANTLLFCCLSISDRESQMLLKQSLIVLEGLGNSKIRLLTTNWMKFNE